VLTKLSRGKQYCGGDCVIFNDQLAHFACSQKSLAPCGWIHSKNAQTPASMAAIYTIVLMVAPLLLLHRESEWMIYWYAVPFQRTAAFRFNDVR